MSTATLTADAHADEHAPAPVLPEAVALTATHQDHYSRALAILRFVTLIPQLVAVTVLTVVWTLTTVAGYVAVLITGRYPERLWNFNVGALRWVARVWASAYGMTDRSPPFSLQDDPLYPVRINAER